MGKVVIISLNQGGELPFTQQDVAWGDQVDVAVVTKDGYIFLGWESNVADIASESTSLSFTMPEQDVTLVASFIANTTRDGWINDAIEAKIEKGDLITSDQLQVMAMEAPVIAVEDGVAKVGVSLKSATSLDGEWTQVEAEEAEVTDDGVISVSVPADEKAAFYKFVVPNKQ